MNKRNFIKTAALSTVAALVSPITLIAKEEEEDFFKDWVNISFKPEDKVTFVKTSFLGREFFDKHKKMILYFGPEDKYIVYYGGYSYETEGFCFGSSKEIVTEISFKPKPFSRRKMRIIL